MIHLTRNKRWSFVLLLAMSMLVMLMMSYFGLRLKGFRPKNNVQWSDSGAGLTFKRFAIAYSQSFFTPADNPSSSHLTIECALETRYTHPHPFSFVFVVHDGRDEHQLVMGQWRRTFIIMNGSDYSQDRGVPRITIELDENVGKLQLVTIVSDASGTAVYLDGKLKNQKPAFVLKYPEKADQARLVVGNNLYGDRPWTGKLGGLAFYDRALDKGVIQQHYHAWHNGRDFKKFQSDAPKLLYTFDEGAGNWVHNRTGAGSDLQVPTRMKPLKISVLSWPKFEVHAIDSLIKDVIVNLIGFIPLGFILVTTLSRLDGFGNRTLWVTVVVFSFGFSLLFETVQVWIPSRNSSALDLILNTVGSGIGVVFFNMVRGRVGIK